MVEVFDLFQFTNRYIAGPNLAHNEQLEGKFWHEVANSDSVQSVLLQTTMGHSFDPDQIRSLIQKGISEGMLRRLHRYVRVIKQGSEFLVRVA